MNIFYLDKNPDIAAQQHCQAHINKMILESAQMFSTVFRMQYDNQQAVFVNGVLKMVYLHPTDIITKNVNGHSVLQPTLYLDTHHNHPCTIGLRENAAYFNYSWDLYQALSMQYLIIRNKNHKSSFLLSKKFFEFYSNFTFDAGLKYNIEVPLAMPVEFKKQCPVDSYRSYYIQKLKDWSTGRKVQQRYFKNAYKHIGYLPNWLAEHFYLDSNSELNVI